MFQKLDKMPITGRGTVYSLPNNTTEISRHCKMIYNTSIFFFQAQQPTEKQ